jgi:chemotaxis protein MotB
MVGERTELVDTARHFKVRRPGLGWILLTMTLAAGAIAGWFLWERGRLAAEEAARARANLDDANARAAAAEDQILALSAERWRGPALPGPDIDLAAVAESLRGAIDRHAGDVAVDDGAQRVVVTLDDPDLFRGDDAELTNRGELVVDKLAGALAGAGDRTLWIHGHVDDAPLPDDALFESPWELSAARALAIVERLAAAGLDAHRLAAVAFGDSRPRGQDRARNRRVEVIVDAASPPPASARSAGARSR